MSRCFGAPSFGVLESATPYERAELGASMLFRKKKLHFKANKPPDKVNDCRTK